MAKSKAKAKKTLVVAFVDSASNEVLVLDILKLNVKNEDLKFLQQAAKDAAKSGEGEITLPEESCPSNFDYSEYKSAEVSLPHRVDAILTVITQDALF